jgi:hypothetical protein
LYSGICLTTEEKHGKTSEVREEIVFIEYKNTGIKNIKVSDFTQDFYLSTFCVIITTIICQHELDKLIFVMAAYCVYCESGIESLYSMLVNFSYTSLALLNPAL